LCADEPQLQIDQPVCEPIMDDTISLKNRVKAMMVENLMLQVPISEIGDDQPLFGPNSLGLDSVDALQLVVGLDKGFGLKISDPGTAKDVLKNVNSMVAAVQRKMSATDGSP
jgi:acyl carrier protein